jgi:hypothetical protein
LTLKEGAQEPQEGAEQLLGSTCRICPSYQHFPPTLQRQNTEISKQMFPEKEYRSLSPNFHIHATVSDLYIPTIGLPILQEEICRPLLGLYESLTDTLGLRPSYSQKRNS